MTDATLLSAPGALPARAGPLPAYTRSNPQTQLDQQPGHPLSEALIETVGAWPGVTLSHSLRAPPGTVGFFLDEPSEQPPEAFLLGREFAHVHPHPDHSLHMVLPEPLRGEAIAKGWAVPHHLAGAPSVSPLTVLVFAPRDAQELAVVSALVAAARRLARGD